ncbi:MAG TPA: hypothetical protein VGM39_21395 [Kofleriaceae bacterium]|jgi:hypothetical protein
MPPVPADWVLAVEAAYVATITKQPVVRTKLFHEPAPVAAKLLRRRAHAAIGAVASHFLAVGTPRTIGLVMDDSIEDAAMSVEAHLSWFAPTEVRCAGSKAPELADLTRRYAASRETSLHEALACDIVCIHSAIAIPDGALRRGTHVNVLAAAVGISDDLAKVAVITHETPGLGELAAGFVDGRQLDEITIFVVGDAAIALAALS